jgi:invasion protein IalB
MKLTQKDRCVANAGLRMFTAVGLGLVPAVALAQGAVTSPVPAMPERTTASFADWTMRCDASGAGAKRVCEVAQIMTAQGQTSPAAQIALGKPAANDSKRITLVLPVNVTLLSKPVVGTAQPSAKSIELTWQRCTPGACFASAPISDEMIGILAAQTEPGKIIIRDAAEREIVLPLSFRGLRQALAELAKS